MSRRHWDFAEGDGGGVKFSLRSNISFSEENLNPSYFVLIVLKHGYLLPLKQKPPGYFAQNNYSALKHATFVQNAIETISSHGLIEEVLTPAYCCNPLAGKGRRRLVLDLRTYERRFALEEIQRRVFKGSHPNARRKRLFYQIRLNFRVPSHRHLPRPSRVLPGTIT